jgi:hypothetical protein
MGHHLLYLVGDSISAKTVHLAAHFTANLWSHLAHLRAQYPGPRWSSVSAIGVKSFIGVGESRVDDCDQSTAVVKSLARSQFADAISMDARSRRKLLL